MERILILRTSSLGDILHGLPVAAALKEAYPWIRLSWMVEERYEDLLLASPCVDERIPVHFRQGPRTLLDARKRKSWARLARLAGRKSFDIVIDLQGLTRTGLLSYWTRAPIRIGFPIAEVREAPNALFSNLRPKSIPARSHVIDRNLALLHPFGVRTGKRSFPIVIRPEWERPILPLLGPQAGEKVGPLRVAIHPAAGWPSKEWGPQRYAELADRILTHWQAVVLLLWGPGERRLAQALSGYMKREARLVPDLDLKGLMALLKHCDLCVGGDSGPVHLASALGTPTVALYGPSDPERNGPPGSRARVVKSSVSCGPCWKRRCRDTRCMRSITVEDAWDQVQRAVEEMKREGRSACAPPSGS